MRRIAPWTWAVAALLAGCGEPAAVDGPQIAAAVETAPVEPTPAAVSSELEPIPRPDLSPLADSVEQQVEQELAELSALMDAPEPEPAELAERFGRLGRVYHAYGLLDPALGAYRNAERLAGADVTWPYLQAVVAQKQGDDERAVAHLERALELEPDHLPSLLRLAELLLLAGDAAAAGEHFQAALDRDPKSAAAAHGLARVATASGDHAAAVRLFQRVLELQPEADSTNYLLALAYRRAGDRDSAERHMALRGVMPVTFEDPLVDGLDELRRGIGIHLERGLLAFGDGRHEDAITEYRAVLELEPENPTALRTLALTLATANRHDEAIRWFEKMLAIYPDHQLARLEHATVLLERGREAEAIDSLREAIRRDPDFADAHFNLATAYSRLDRWQEAADGFREVLRIDRANAEARYSLGVALDELQRPGEAATELKLALAADPAHLRARQRLGSVLERIGQPAAALEQYRVVLGLEAPAEEKGLAHYQIGRLLTALDRDDEALASFERAVELFPQLWQGHFAIANWLSRHGRHGEAAERFGRLARADPDNILTRQREADSLIRAGRYADAHRRLEQGLAEHPRSFELASVLARLLATAPEPGLRDGQRALELAEELFAAQRSIDQAETLAMALAELERFDEAAELQRKIVAWAESEGDTEAAARLRRNLARYESRQPVRQVAG